MPFNFPYKQTQSNFLGRARKGLAFYFTLFYFLTYIVFVSFIV